MIITIFKAPSNKTQMKEKLLHLLQHLCSRCGLETKVVLTNSKNHIYRLIVSAVLNMSADSLRCTYVKKNKTKHSNLFNIPQSLTEVTELESFWCVQLSFRLLRFINTVLYLEHVIIKISWIPKDSRPQSVRNTG